MTKKDKIIYLMTCTTDEIIKEAKALEKHFLQTIIFQDKNFKHIKITYYSD